MQPDITQEFQQYNCLNVLDRMLALAMQTAEAASAEQNHRLVLQAIREVSRLVTLINKIAITSDQKPESKGKPPVGPTPNAELDPQTGKWEKSGKLAGKKGLIERFFKDNLPVKRCEKNIAAGGLTCASVSTSQHHDRAAGVVHWHDEPVILVAEGA
jgi:hypothetical protein